MNKKAYAIGAALLVAISIGTAQAHEEIKSDQQADEKIVTATNLVTVNVIVTDPMANM